MAADMPQGMGATAGSAARGAPHRTAEDRAGAVFGALADPMRRRLLSEIAAHPATATELASGLPISRQAVAKHLTSLSEAGLLERERAGRDVRYRVTPQPLSEAVSWMAEVGGQWDARLARLGRALER
jgi:DNA-binding transcriptional ArsR family regulator